MKFMVLVQWLGSFPEFVAYYFRTKEEATEFVTEYAETHDQSAKKISLLEILQEMTIGPTDESES